MKQGLIFLSPVFFALLGTKWRGNLKSISVNHEVCHSVGI